MNTLVEKEKPRSVQRGAETAYLLPVADIFETRDAYVIEAEMPGVNRSGLDITLEGHTLTLTGRRDAQVPSAEVLYKESKPAGFRRVFELEPTIDAGKVSAHFEQGLLIVHLPKAESVKPRKITVGD